MEQRTALVFGWLLASLAFIGLMMGSGHFLHLINVDNALIALRVVVAGIILYAAYKGTADMTRSVLRGLGAMYLGIGLIALVDRKAGGLLPSGLTGFDLLTHLIAGAIIIWLSSRREASTAGPVTT